MSKPTYQEAFEELQQIVADIEDGQISVDELSEKVKRASVLIRQCKTKLVSTEENVQKILAAIEQPDNQETNEDEEKENEDEEGNEESESTQNDEEFPF